MTGVSPDLAQMWKAGQSQRRCGGDEPSPGADVPGLSAVRVQVESLTDIEVATRLLQTTQVRRTNSTLCHTARACLRACARACLPACLRACLPACA